jgi:hypothetical protein
MTKRIKMKLREEKNNLAYGATKDGDTKLPPFELVKVTVYVCCVVNPPVAVTTIAVNAPLVGNVVPAGTVPAIVPPAASLKIAPFIATALPPDMYWAYTVAPASAAVPDAACTATFSCAAVPPFVIVANVPLVNM